MTVSIRCRVSGRVQGVFFRDSTQRQARELGLTGYAKNLPDGSVEVLACGVEERVAALQAWLQVGPPAARVTAVDCQLVDVPAPEQFTTA